MSSLVPFWNTQTDADNRPQGTERTARHWLVSTKYRVWSTPYYAYLVGDYGVLVQMIHTGHRVSSRTGVLTLRLIHVAEKGKKHAQASQQMARGFNEHSVPAPAVDYHG